MLWLGQHWVAFLIAAISCYTLVFLNQLRLMSRMTKLDDNIMDSFILGVGISVVCGLAATVNFILFIIGAIVAIAKAVH